MALSLEDIKSPGEVKAGGPDSIEKREVDYLRAQAEIEGLRQDILARKTYANRIYWLAVGWLSTVLVILLLQGFRIWGWSLSDNVCGFRKL